MTVSYSLQCSTTRLLTFFKLLFRWKASLYKLVALELLVFLVSYYTTSVVYFYALPKDAQKIFENISVYFCNNISQVPITFVLGFYVSLVVSRWWDQFKCLMWPDRFALHVAAFVSEIDDDRSRLIRRAMVRYVNAASVICLRNISTAVRKRFPTTQHLVEAGFLTEDELEMYEELAKLTAPDGAFWVPIQWCVTLIIKSRKEGRIASESMSYNMMKEVLDFRQSLFSLFGYDWLSIPLVYTQVVTLSVYAYFCLAIFAHQQLAPTSDVRNTCSSPYIYFPVTATIQLVFYVGWLKVAETLLNPFGEDDDDFELNYIIDRNTRIAYLQVTNNFDKLPPLEKDLNYNNPAAEVPYTAASLGLKSTGFEGSVAQIEYVKQFFIKSHERIKSFLFPNAVATATQTTAASLEKKDV